MVISRYRDLTGQRFGKLVVTERTNECDNWGNTLWSCRCDCGNTHLLPGFALTSGNTKSCGCYRANAGKPAHNFIDLTGQRFGKLVALRPERRNGKIKWVCKCDCGNTHEVQSRYLRNGVSTHCGCEKVSKKLDLVKEYG